MVMDANVKLFKAKSQVAEDKINFTLSKMKRYSELTSPAV